MIANSFIWTDLSTYDVKKSCSFYSKVFGWDFTDFEGYSVALAKNDFSNEIVGLYETPPFFQKIKMPHFWMNYVQVDNALECAQKAGNLGGKIEIEKAEFYGGNIALIRDPLGAGFTVYDGNLLKKNQGGETPHVIGRELHVSDCDKAIEFYSSLFGWSFQQNGNGDFEVRGTSETSIVLREFSNDIKGKYEYWVTIFGVADLKNYGERVISNGGSLIMDEYDQVLLCDDSGEAFFYLRQV